MKPFLTFLLWMIFAHFLYKWGIEHHVNPPDHTLGYETPQLSMQSMMIGCSSIVGLAILYKKE